MQLCCYEINNRCLLEQIFGMENLLDSTVKCVEHKSY